MIYKYNLRLFIRGFMLLYLLTMNVDRSIADPGATVEHEDKLVLNMQIDRINEKYDHSIPEVIATTTEINESNLYPNKDENLNDNINVKGEDVELKSEDVEEYHTDDIISPDNGDEGVIDEHQVYTPPKELESEENNKTQEKNNLELNNSTTNDKVVENVNVHHKSDDIKSNDKTHITPEKIYNKLIKHDKHSEHLPDEHVEGDKIFPDNPLISHNNKFVKHTTHYSNKVDDNSICNDNCNECKKIKCDSECTGVVEIDSDECPVVESRSCGASKRGLKSRKSSRKSSKKSRKSKSRKSRKSRKSKSKKDKLKKRGKSRRKNKNSSNDNESEGDDAKDAIDEAKEAKKRAKEAEIEAKKAKADAEEAQKRAEAREKRVKVELESKKEEIDNEEDELDSEIGSGSEDGSGWMRKWRKNKRKNKRGRRDRDFDLPKCEG